MDGAAAGGGGLYGDSMATRGGEEKTMKVAQATAGMVGGAGELSYTRNSSFQSQSINILKPILEQEIMELELFKDWSGSTIRMADFGCSMGANTLGYAEICYRNVYRTRLSSGREFPDEVQYFFCDLPSNDFNTLFLQLEDWRKTQTSMEDFYVTAVPGSFYGRLLPRESLHVAISTFAVNWMSQVPDEVLDKSSPAYNKGRAMLDGNENVASLQAYMHTVRQDLRKFLLSRANEVVPSGLVVIYTRGRVDECHPLQEGVNSTHCSKVFEETWEELVNEVSIHGIIEEERRDTFNIPIFNHSVDDMKIVAKSTNAFHIKRCEIFQQSYLSPNEAEQILTNPNAYGLLAKKFTKSIMNSIMVKHIGEEQCHEFFERFEKNAATVAREKRVSFLPMDCILAILIQK